MKSTANNVGSPNDMQVGKISASYSVVLEHSSADYLYIIYNYFQATAMWPTSHKILRFLPFDRVVCISLCLCTSTQGVYSANLPLWIY